MVVVEVVLRAGVAGYLLILLSTVFYSCHFCYKINVRCALAGCAS